MDSTRYSSPDEKIPPVPGTNPCAKKKIKENYHYRKHQQMSHTFLLKMFLKNWDCGLNARTSGQRAINLH